MAQARKELGWATILTLALIGVFAVLMIVSMAAVFFFGRSSKSDAAPEIVAKSSGPTITQLQSLGELVVLRVSVADVLEASGLGYKGAWLIKGDALIAIDLRLAKFQSADEETKKLVVLLPPPKVIQPRVDHDKTKTWDLSKTTWVPFGGDPDKLRDATMREAQRLVNHACTKEEIIEQGRYNTKLLLTHMYRFIDWDVEIVWDDKQDAKPAEPTK